MVGTIGAGFVIAELIWPNSHPVRMPLARLKEQAPNLLVALAMPGGVALLLQGLRMLTRWRDDGRDVPDTQEGPMASS
jgi:hypothetical protein